MKSEIRPKTVALWFVIVLGLYLAIFYATEYGNRRRGPWEVEFRSDALGNPSIVIDQPKLHIATVRISFTTETASQTNLSRRVLFERPVATLPYPMPFGEVIYEDLRSLPGVVTFNFFGHEIEFLPRVLIVNKKEIPWKSGALIELSPTNKPAHAPRPPKGWEQRP